MRLNYHRAGQGSPLILVHGIGSRWQMWAPVLDALTAEHDVIALDLPGFGASPMPPAGTPAGPDSLVTLVSEFLAELGIERPHAAGNSLGGLIVLEMARRGLVRSATPVSPAGFASRIEQALGSGELWIAVRGARRLAPRAGSVMRSPIARAVVLSGLIARPTAMSPSEAAESLRALAAAPWFDATLPTITPMHFRGGQEITVPVTVAWGEKDRVLFPRQAARAAREIPRARIVKLTGCGHVATYDDPAQVAGVLLDGARD
ncbi:MAG TPA: alpha/beta fold hydrolase [Solirubrobacteraceae bacterium]|jgi:pimeloyl-ACP methyl ester carboxylesterase